MKTSCLHGLGKCDFIFLLLLFFGWLVYPGECGVPPSTAVAPPSLYPYIKTHPTKSLRLSRDWRAGLLTPFSRSKNAGIHPDPRVAKRINIPGTMSAGTSLGAGELWSNTITGTDPGLTSPYIAGDLADPNMTVSGIRRGIGINGAAAVNRYNANGWSTTTLDKDDYFEFTLAPVNGYEINLASFAYTGQLSSGTAGFSVRSSFDGYVSDIGAPNSAGTIIDLAAADFQGLACAITFRFYVYGVAASSTTYSINDFIFNGTATTAGVPRLTISGAGTTAGGNIESGANPVILSTFTITSNTSQTLGSVMVSSVGSATGADLDNVRILYDANANGVIDVTEGTAVSGPGVSLTNPMLFNLSGQTFNCSRRYLVVADVLQTATAGHSVATSISANTSVTSTVLNTTGSAIGNLQTIAFATAASDFFKSVAAGNWNIAATWESSHNGTNWYNATAAPTSGAMRIEILTGHTITINGSGVSMTNTFIKNGAVLAISSNNTYTIGGTGTQLTIENGGILSVNFSSTSIPLIPGTGERLVKSGGKIWIGPLLNDGTTIGNAYANAATSKFTYENASIFEWANPSTVLSNNADEIYFKTVSSTDLPVFKISVTPGNLYGGAGTNIFNCIWEANANCGFTGTGTKTIRGGFRGSANITQTGGALILPNSWAVLDGTVTINIVSSGLRMTNGAIIPAGANVKITSSPEDQTLNKQTGSLLVNGTLDITDLQVANSSGDVTLSATGKLKTSNIQGFSGTGATIVSGTINLLTGSTVELNRLGSQAIQLSPDPLYKNIILSGSGTKTPSSAFNPVGTVTLKENVSFDCTGKNVGNAGTGLAMSDNSILIVSTTATQPSMAALPYNLVGGTIKFNGSNITSENIRSENYYNIEVYGTNVKNSAGNIFIRDQGSFTVKTGGVFEMSDNSIVGLSGSQALVAESNSTFRCAVQPGFHGPAAFPNSPAVRDNIDIITLQPNSTIDYSRSTPGQVSGDQVITNTMPYQNLVISGTGNKTAPPGTLNIQGNFSKTGTSIFANNNGTALFIGTAAQSFTNTSGSPVLFNNVSISNVGAGLTINSDSFSVAGELLLSAGSKLNLGSGNVILKSTLDRTANVAPISTATINYPGPGRFIVERYIRTGGKWQYLSAPTIGQSIKEGWQENASIATENPKAGYGMHITSPLHNSTATVLGFDDYTIRGSVKYYDSTSVDGWKEIPNTTDNFDPTIGYMTFVRSSRDLPVNTNSSGPTTLRNKGQILYGPQPPVSVGAYQLRAIANPYPSPVDLTKIRYDNNQKFYLWDPTLGGTQGVGGYQAHVYNSNTNNYEVSAFSSVGSGNSYGAINNFVQSGQAFFTIGGGSAGSVSFKETDKNANGYGLVSFIPINRKSNGSVRANLINSSNGKRFF
jgi:hypothetical protein